MSRSNKTWGSSRTALQNRVQQSRVARNEIPAPDLVDVAIQQRPLGEIRVRRNGEVLEIVSADGLLWRNPVAHPTEFERDVSGILKAAARKYSPSNARVLPAFVLTEYPKDAPLNPINLNSLTSNLVQTVWEFIFAESRWDGTPPLSLVTYSAEEFITYKKHLQKWCSYIVRKYFLPRRELHRAVAVRINRKHNIQSWFRSDLPVDASGPSTKINIEQTYKRITSEIDVWAKNPDVYTTPEQRPTLLQPDPLFNTADRVMYARYRKDFTRLVLISDRVDADGFRLMRLTGNTVFGGGRDSVMQYLHEDNLALHIARCAVGFFLDREFKRPWSDFDIEAYSKDAYHKYRQLRMARYLKKAAELTEHRFYRLGFYEDRPYVLVPLLTPEEMELEGHMMQHCVTNATHFGKYRRFYSIREATIVNEEWIPGRPRITFDLELHRCDDYMNGSLAFTEEPTLHAESIPTRWVVSSIKGIRNMNNEKWRPLLQRAGLLLGVEYLYTYYHATSEHCDDEA